MNQCIRLASSLVEFSKTRPVNEVKQAMVGVVSVLGNIRMVEEIWDLNNNFYRNKLDHLLKTNF